MPQQDDTRPLIDQVKEWITQSGFPLEMRVAAALRKHQRPVVGQGVHYKDSATGELRETDVAVWWHVAENLPGVIGVFECKGTDAPWIIFMRGQKQRREDADRHVVCNNVPKGFMNDVAGTFEMAGNSLLQYGAERGYAITEKRTERRGSQDHAHVAVRQVVSATTGILDGNGHRALIALPFVVTTSPLFECSLNDDNDTEVHQVQRSSLRVSTNAGAALVRVIHVDEIGEVAKDIADLAQAVSTCNPLPSKVRPAIPWQ